MAKSKILTPDKEAELNNIKTKIETQIRLATPANILQVACDNFKYIFEEAIKIAGIDGKNSLTTSSKHIQLFHEVVKSELIRLGVSGKLIFPKQYNSKGELKLAGFIKSKNQDISVVPNEFINKENPELITIGMMKGETDIYGKAYTENTLVINVRSQMSSIGNNDDTIFERAFAETLNLHMRCKQMVLGELFIFPITGFDINEVKKSKAIFEPIISTKKRKNTQLTSSAIEKCIHTYSALNNRDIEKGEEYKYERICLILADFSQTPVKIYKHESELKKDNLLPQDSTVTLANIGFDKFVEDLLGVYHTRFPNNSFT